MNNLEIKKNRRKLGLTQTELAKKLGVSLKTIQNYENGETIPESKIELLHSVLGNITQKEKLVKNDDKIGVPYFDGEVTSTITTSFLDVPTNPTFYINIPPLNDCDAYITNRGDSMFPKYRNGEILGIKRIYNFNVLQWGESHLVITNESANNMRTVKNVHPHPDFDKVILRASNPNNAGDTVVPKEDILEIYIIKANLDISHL